MNSDTKFEYINYEGLKNPVVARPDSTDIPTAYVIFKKLVYDLDRVKLHGNTHINLKPQFIIDGGANVGYASVFFATKYPEVKKIVAIEPEKDNFAMLTLNTQIFPQVERILAGLHYKETNLAVNYPRSGRFDAFMTSEVENSAPPPRELTRGITIGKILRESGFKYIDILKLDIEGAEKEIFSEEGNYQEWLPFVKVLIIELHDRMKHGCSHNFFQAISKYESFFAFSGENLIFIREDLL